MQIWRDAFRRGVVATLPGPLIPKAPEPERLPEAWNIAELTAILRAAGGEPGVIAGLPASWYWVSLFLALYDSGGRIGAVSAVRCEDIRLDDPAGVILKEENSKTHAATWHALHPQTVQACRHIWRPGREPMWPWPYNVVTRRHHVKALCKRAGIRVGRPCGGVFHKFRRTSGTLVEANGGDGSRQLGNTRAVFLRSYLDPRIAGRGQLDFLPRPEF